MSTTTAPPEPPATAPGPDDRPGDDAGAGRTWPLLVWRVVLVGLSSAIALALLLGFLAWIALRIEWRVPEASRLSGPSVVLLEDGSELARFTAEVDRRVVGLDEVSRVAVAAVVSAEDTRFYEHDGVDPLSLLRAVVANVRTGGITQGGSTLTQQYVKNAFVGDDQTVRRKVQEAVISISLERELSKDEILERYLNQVYFGEGAYGIEAAALTYFEKPAAELTVAEGATLAQILPAPSRFNPRVDPEGSVARRDRVITQMLAADRITPAEATEARSTPLQVVPRQAPETRYPFVVEYVRKQLAATYGEEAVLTGALRVTVTIDPEAQAALEAAVAEQLPQQPDRPDVDAGAVAVEPSTGRVLAVYAGRDPVTSQFDLATQARRRPGSTFKPIAYIAALEAGIEPDDTFRAPARFREGELCDPGWGPSNAGGRGFGTITLREALVQSVNTVFAQIGCEAGAERIAEVAARLGDRSTIEVTPQLAIGGFGSNSTVLDMAHVFATIANDGVDCVPHLIARVEGPDGEVLDRPDEVDAAGAARRPSPELLAARPDGLAADDDPERGCHRMVDADVVRTTTQTLTEVVERSTGTRADIDRPQAGKTGTTDEEVDAWYAGYTPDLALVVRVGDRLEEPLTDIAGFDRVQGGTIPALIWRDAAAAILADVPPTEFPQPGEEDRIVGPARQRARPAPATTETETPTQAPTQAPSAPASPRPSPSPSPSEGPRNPLDPGGGGGGGGGGCIPLLQDCDEEPPDGGPDGEGAGDADAPADTTDPPA
ncbi:MAG: transglycosylase domain-containing protein [Actinomycetes bacterium]